LFGDIPAGKGMNLPSSHLDIPSLTAKDDATAERLHQCVLRTIGGGLKVLTGRPTRSSQ
jgi:hypothetical protein